jgi:hypothetical protein
MPAAQEDTGGIPTLDAETAAQLASLVAIGRQSGDTVVGLSAVRRVKKLAYILVDFQLAAGTLRELEARQRQGTILFRVESIQVLSRAFGREDILVLGIKQGDLARGIAGRLQRKSS